VLPSRSVLSGGEEQPAFRLSSADDSVDTHGCNFASTERDAAALWARSPRKEAAMRRVLTMGLLMMVLGGCAVVPLGPYGYRGNLQYRGDSFRGDVYVGGDGSGGAYHRGDGQRGNGRPGYGYPGYGYPR
jgi:hypothetical protein